MRAWWLPEAKLTNNHGDYVYGNCNITSPPSLFEDQTTDFNQFLDDLNSGEQCRLVNALNNDKIMMPNALCPFGCSEYCHKAKVADWDLIIQ